MLKQMFLYYFFFAKNLQEILGVYSTYEKAKKAYDLVLKDATGTFPYNTIHILERELDYEPPPS